jgi:hypothetical protein
MVYTEYEISDNQTCRVITAGHVMHIEKIVTCRGPLILGKMVV